MKHVLFLFLDGVGLGKDDPQENPFAAVDMPILRGLLDGQTLFSNTTPLETQKATLLALDANLNVPGIPQSASGQAALLTGKNIPELLGKHYGPKPNQQIAAELKKNNLFRKVQEMGKTTAFLNAYPPRYFENIESGKRLPGAIAMAALYSGMALRTKEDLYQGNALSADFTGEGWRRVLDFPDTPVLQPTQAGTLMAVLSQAHHFSLFEYWPTDFAGHRQDMEAALAILQTLDLVLAGLLSEWDENYGLVLITSDHGNMENLHSRRHTENKVPCLVIGSRTNRRHFSQNLTSLTDIYAAVLNYLDD